MPLFAWVRAFATGWQIGQALLDGFEGPDRGGIDPTTPLDEDREALARLLAQRGERERTEEAELARSRWLEEHRAERTFPCGIVPDPRPADVSAAPPTVAAPRLATPPDDESRPGWAAPLPSQPGWGMPEPDVVPPEPASELPGADLKPMQVLAAVLPADVVFIREYGDDEEVEEVGRLPRRAIQEVDVVDSSGAHVPEPVEETWRNLGSRGRSCAGRTRALPTRTGSRSDPPGWHGRRPGSCSRPSRASVACRHGTPSSRRKASGPSRPRPRRPIVIRNGPV